MGSISIYTEPQKRTQPPQHHSLVEALNLALYKSRPKTTGELFVHHFTLIQEAYHGQHHALGPIQ
jgi:hypothetical protein